MVSQTLKEEVSKMSEFSERFMRLASKMVLLVKALSKYEEKGQRVENLIDFIIDSGEKFVLESWLEVPFPVVKAKRYVSLLNGWADGRYLAIQYEDNDLTGDRERNVVLYDSKTLTRIVAPYRWTTTLEGCFTPQVCDKAVFLLYFLGGGSRRSWVLDMLNCEYKKERKKHDSCWDIMRRDFEDLSQLRDYYDKKTPEELFVKHNDKVRLIAFLNRVISGKEQAQSGWTKFEWFYQKNHKQLSAPGVRWRIFPVEIPKKKDEKEEKTQIYIQRVEI